jgi:hypothetical protein
MWRPADRGPSFRFLVVEHSVEIYVALVAALFVALTFAEVFPIGLAVTLLSAGILRKKTGSPKQ